MAEFAVSALKLKFATKNCYETYTTISYNTDKVCIWLTSLVPFLRYILLYRIQNAELTLPHCGQCLNLPPPNIM